MQFMSGVWLNVPVENLGELIERCIAERGETLTAFAARIGSNRQTLRGWRSSFPASSTLHRVADALEVPYPTVLTAALVSGGYIDNPGDVLGHHDVHVVVQMAGEPYERGEASPAAVFTDADKAAEFVDVSSAVKPDVEFGCGVVVVDAAVPPPAVRIHTLTWSHRTDRVEESSWLCGGVPTRIGPDGVSAVEGREITDTGDIYQLQVDSIDLGKGRAAIMAVLDDLRAAGRLLGPDRSVPGVQVFDFKGGASVREFEKLPHVTAATADIGADGQLAGEAIDRLAGRLSELLAGRVSGLTQWAVEQPPVPAGDTEDPEPEDVLSDQVVAGVAAMLAGHLPPALPTRRVIIAPPGVATVNGSVRTEERG